MLLTPRLFVLDQDPARPADSADTAYDASPARAQTVLQKGLLPLPGICIIPRGACSFRRVRLAGTGRNAVKAAALKADQDALPGETGSLIRPDKGTAVTAVTPTHMAGIWNFARDPDHKGRYLPETLAQTPLDDGVRLVSGLSGYEGQIWVGGNLVASRWWMSDPSQSNWDIFIRAAQEELGAINAPLPTAMSVPWRSDLSALSFEKEHWAHILTPVNLGAVAATLLACGYGYIGAQYVRETVTLSKTNADMEAMSAETALILSQRRRAIANLRHARKYDALGRNDRVLNGLSGLATVLAGTDLAIERLDLRLGQMEMRLKGESEISVPDVVSLLEAQDGLSSVSVTLDAQGAVLIQADLAGADQSEVRR